MVITEVEAVAGIAIIASQLGLDSADTITLSVQGANDNFTCIYQNGLQSFTLGNNQVTVLSKDKVFIYGGLLILIGLIVGTILNNK